jgi:hypothetical protein
MDIDDGVLWAAHHSRIIPRSQGNRERAGATPLRIQEPLSPRGFSVFTPGDPGLHPAQLVRRKR